MIDMTNFDKYYNRLTELITREDREVKKHEKTRDNLIRLRDLIKIPEGLEILRLSSEWNIDTKD